MEQSNNTTIDTAEVKPGRDYEISEDIIENPYRDLKPGDMLIFKKDISDKAFEALKSLITEFPLFMAKHKVDAPGGPSWNEFAKFFCREYAWAAENILNSKQIRIINLKNRLKRKVINLPVECVLVRAIKL